MRKFLLLIGIFFAYNISAQVLNESQVPDAIRNSVKSQYPNIKVRQWKKVGSRYEAFYIINENVGATLIYDQGGVFIESEKRIGFQEIPNSILQHVSQKMPGKKISDAFRIVTGLGNMSYKVIIDGKEKYFDPQGKPLPGRVNDTHAGHEH